VITIDITGRMEIWDPQTADFPKNSKKLKYDSKIKTDFYVLA